MGAEKKCKFHQLCAGKKRREFHQSDAEKSGKFQQSVDKIMNFINRILKRLEFVIPSLKKNQEFHKLDADKYSEFGHSFAEINCKFCQ